MRRAEPHDDQSGWYEIYLQPEPGDAMQERVNWCQMQPSDARFDYGVRWGWVIFRFEQLEDATMFRLRWGGRG